MTATEKRKYISSKILEMLAPYGYFSRYNAVWKCSLEGKYVVCISLDLGRAGAINELDVDFGSFFGPIQKELSSAQRLFLGNRLYLESYVRSVGLNRYLIDFRQPFEEQVAAILPYFQQIVLPLLPTNDDLGDFLGKSEQLVQLKADTYQGIPLGVDISETAFAYLSLDRPAEALRALSHYAEQCRYAASCFSGHSGKFRFDEERVRLWEHKQQGALALKAAIQAGESKGFEAEMKQREAASVELCRQFFHLSR